MRKIIVLLILVSFANTTLAQKVKFKKDQVLIDEVLKFKIEDAGTVQIFASLSGKDFLTITANSYVDEEDEAKIVIGSKKWIYTLRFMDTSKMMYTVLRPKEIIAKVYNAKMVNEDGTIDPKDVEDFINKYNNAELKHKL